MGHPRVEGSGWARGWDSVGGWAGFWDTAGCWGHRCCCGVWGKWAPEGAMRCPVWGWPWVPCPPWGRDGTLVPGSVFPCSWPGAVTAPLPRQPLPGPRGGFSPAQGPPSARTAPSCWTGLSEGPQSSARALPAPAFSSPCGLGLPAVSQRSPTPPKALGDPTRPQSGNIPTWAEPPPLTQPQFILFAPSPRTPVPAPSPPAGTRGQRRGRARCPPSHATCGRL